MNYGVQLAGRQERKENTISVVIPTLNAADHLGATIAALGNATMEFIVVDGGSTDGTPAIAAGLGARVITAQRGRGSQLAAGVAASQGNWLLLLHADTRLAPGWRDHAQAHMDGNPERAGYFRFALDSDARAARRLERAVAWRCYRLALPYGDQGLLIPSDLLRSIGGIRPLPIMEDVDLARRLGRHRLAPLAADAITSAARWQRDGWHRRSLRNIACLGLYLCGLPPRLIVRLYR